MQSSILFVVVKIENEGTHWFKILRFLKFFQIPLFSTQSDYLLALWNQSVHRKSKKKMRNGELGIFTFLHCNIM